MMARTSDQGFDSNESDKGWHAETFNDREMAEDELSENLDSCSTRSDDMVPPSIEKLPLSLEPLEPYIGMEFESADDAREFYENYGRRTGFTIRNNRIRRSHKDNSIIGWEFVCSKEGFRAEKYVNRENRFLPPRPITREGCNAMVRIAVKDGGNWFIYGFVREHNHELNPSKVPPRRSHKIAYNEDEKDLKIRELSRELHLDGELCAGEDAELIQSSSGKELVVFEGDENIEPYMGMEFESEEAAKVYYDTYATRMGFVMRVDAFRRSLRDGKVICRRLVCNKEGFRKIRPKRSESRKPRAITREGCKAMIMVKREKTGKWVVTKFIKEHNHPLVVSSGNTRRSLLLSQTPDEKDRKIRELSTELHRERKRSAAYQEQLDMVLKDIEEHTQHLSRNIEDIVQNVKDIETKRLVLSHSS
ncbi:hypothetical protein HHK36_013250 [Tetracentron sinense]|uniref:FAR1 domain-containing protein n=1 Tax=Tetracentron sinense TaxID=13715 RepID=A0A835DGA4_TETSI|nr:hypothetical protein HHK36_013250 [Tetracentron sinense]